MELVGEAAAARSWRVRCRRGGRQADHQGNGLPFGEERLDGGKAGCVGFSSAITVSGWAWPVSVSPTATPMQARPKSKARTVPTSGVPGDIREFGEIDAEQLHGGGEAFFGGTEKTMSRLAGTVSQAF